MTTVTISEFRANCFSLLQLVSNSKQPIRVTRFGKPIADVIPPTVTEVDRNAWIGSGAGTGKILVDIVFFDSDPIDREALRD